MAFITLKNTVYINQLKVVVSFPKIIIIIIVVEISPCFRISTLHLITGSYSGSPLSVV